MLNENVMSMFCARYNSKGT